jgi:hypothetical protein
MSYRRFTDRSGNVWEIHDRSRNEWDFTPASGNPEARRTVPAPGYENDPFELSTEELQRMLDSVRSAEPPARRSPFRD